MQVYLLIRRDILCIKQIFFENLNNFPFSVDNISSIELIPKRPFVSHAKQGRVLNGFLYFLEGKCKFVFGTKEIYASEGTLVYLPEGSTHRYEKISEKIKYIRIDFKAFSIPEMEEIIFAETPVKIFSQTPPYCANTIRYLAKSFITNPNAHTLNDKALFYQLLSSIYEASYSSALKDNHMDIIEAINYIERNYTKNFEKSILAEMCNMSQSYFRSQFKKIVGYSPSAYQQQIRIEKAKQLLLSNSSNVSEIAEQLGFESVYYFSRIFKNLTGISPLKFKNPTNNV